VPTERTCPFLKVLSLYGTFRGGDSDRGLIELLKGEALAGHAFPPISAQRSHFDQIKKSPERSAGKCVSGKVTCVMARHLVASPATQTPGWGRTTAKCAAPVR
jgi:hypothetical protein